MMEPNLSSINTHLKFLNIKSPPPQTLFSNPQALPPSFPRQKDYSALPSPLIFTTAMMKRLSQIKLLQASVAFLLTLTLILHSLLSQTTLDLLSRLLSQNRILVLSCAWCLSITLLCYLSTRPRPVYLLDYALFKPDYDRKCSYEVCEYFVRRSNRFSTVSEEFMRGIYLKSGLGDETYAPPFIFQHDYEAKLKSAVQEAEEGMFSAVDSVLSKTQVDPLAIDIVIVTCGMFSPCPSLSSLIVNRYNLRPDVKTFNLSGMGCSSGVASIDLAAKLLSRNRKIGYALVVVTESISLNWYFGDNRSMLVTNCIFRVGCAASLITNDPGCRGSAKMELTLSLRTHHGADDASYKAAFQEEDANGNVGVALTKDLIRVAGEGLRDHIRTLAPRVLPVWELLMYAYSVVTCALSRGDGKPIVPDFTTAFEHLCIHTGGKAVIQQVGRLMRLGDEVTEPARMCLHRFGNTSGSLVFYELAYFEAKGRIKRGDRVWMLAFGTGFKVCSLVWKSLQDSYLDDDNPWSDCIHRYPVNAW
ncbi:3-ketoacyl-CoA synthase 13-like [Magnolia sinica]|uniref:3-ketoacyl-CoA synthase 13-like n=1 Tax=Magnolia sinica TaxID=86752 RepID=UPI0026589ABB|nr:3-ketoacyl-CoA synthase 13-like [Magnolia sinica]